MRRIVVRALAQPDGAHLRERADGLGEPAANGFNARDKRGGDGAEADDHHSQLALGGRDPDFLAALLLVPMLSPNLHSLAADSLRVRMLSFGETNQCTPFEGQLHSCLRVRPSPRARPVCATRRTRRLPRAGRFRRQDESGGRPAQSAGQCASFSPEFHAGIGQSITPWPRTDKRVDVEAQLRHLRDARGKRNERAHDWKQAASRTVIEPYF